MSKWPGIRILKFLEIYEKQECLWNYKCDGYKNKVAKEKAFEAIITELNMPHLTPIDIKLKIKSVRTTYKRELTTVLKSAKLQKQYEPKLFWFHQADSFLRQVSVDRRGAAIVAMQYDDDHKMKDLNEEDSVCPYKTEPTEPNISYEEECAKSGEEYDNIEDDTHFSNKPDRAEQDSTPFKPVVEMTEPSNARNEVNHESANLISKSQANALVHTNRCPTDESSNEDTYNAATVIQTCDSKPGSETHQTATSFLQSQAQSDHYQTKNEEDEYLIFCRGVAAQLRAISDPYARSAAKFKIQQILFEAETGHYTRNSETSFIGHNRANVSNGS